jgi:hypothetical protein
MSAREELIKYFKYVQTERSTSTAKDAMIALQRDPLSGTPLDVTGLLNLSLLHPVFGEFVDGCREIEPTMYTVGQVSDLFRTLTNFHHSASSIVPILGRLFDNKITSPYNMLDSSSGMSISGAITGEVNGSNIPVALIVIKKSGDTLYTGIAFYYHYWGTALLEPRYYIHSEEKRLFRHGCCPCFLIEIRGSQMRISGLAILNKVICQSFTHLLNLYGDASGALEVFRAFEALRTAISKLQDFRVPPPGFVYEWNPSVGVLSNRSLRPYALQNYSDVKQLVSDSYTYVVEGQYVVKYVRTYAQEVHRAWAASQLAPELMDVQKLPGGWFEVKMQYLSSPWRQLARVPSREECSAVIDALKIAHMVPVTVGEEIGVGVHGDARPDNVMIHETTKAVMFIDFELSGLHESSYYPYSLNRAKFWPFPLLSRPVMLQEHDRSWYLADSEYKLIAMRPPSSLRLQIDRMRKESELYFQKHEILRAEAL